MNTFLSYELRCIFPVPRFLKIGEFPEYSPFSLPGNVAFRPNKFLKVDPWMLFSGLLRKIKWQLKSSQRDGSFKPIKSDFEQFFFSHGKNIIFRGIPWNLFGNVFPRKSRELPVPQKFPGYSPGIFNQGYELKCHSIMKRYYNRDNTDT